MASFLILRRRRDGFEDFCGWIPMAHYHFELVEGVLDNIINYNSSMEWCFQKREFHNPSQQTADFRPQDGSVLEQYKEFFNKKRMAKIKGYTTENRHIVSSGYEVCAHIHVMERVGGESDAQRLQVTTCSTRSTHSSRIKLVSMKIAGSKTKFTKDEEAMGGPGKPLLMQ